MTELSFLLSLLLDQKLTKPVQQLIKDRIKEIETQPQTQRMQPRIDMSSVKNQGAQSASTQKILDEMAKEGEALPIPVHVAQTPVAAMALASRQQAINQAISGSSEPGRRSPRKF